MPSFSMKALMIAAGVAGVCFVGYCFYFDKQRRADPDYKKKVSERRRLEREQAREREERELVARGVPPDAADHAAMERYFLQEIQAGEASICADDYAGGVDHFANAIFVCSHPTKLLEMLEASLPPEIFALLILKVREKGRRLEEEDQNDALQRQSSLAGGAEEEGLYEPSYEPSYELD